MGYLWLSVSWALREAEFMNNHLSLKRQQHSNVYKEHTEVIHWKTFGGVSFCLNSTNDHYMYVEFYRLFSMELQHA